MRVWEAALATSAAPFYFKPYVKRDRMKRYVDGALHANMPAILALEEKKRTWPAQKERTRADALPYHETRVDALVSVGTGIQQKDFNIPSVLEIAGLPEVWETFFLSMDTEAKSGWSPSKTRQAGGYS
ncbi:hypothetical protein BJ546DRAFT_205989 [Cryomyces antarcticus]